LIPVNQCAAVGQTSGKWFRRPNFEGCSFVKGLPGHSKEIAPAMKVSPETVKNYLSRVFEKLQVAGRAEAVSRMLRGKHK
jgi:hypothetical protein